MVAYTTGPPYRHFTASEIDAANDTDLPDLLASLGYQVRRVGSYYTTREMDSLRIKDRRIWFRNSENTGGDAVAFVQHFHGMSFPEAVRYLLAFNGYSVDSPAPIPRQRSRPPPQRGRPDFALPPPNGDDERVRAYLLGRGIAPGVIDDFINMGLLYEDAKHHNCVFVGRDGAGKPVFAAKRGTCDSVPFRGDVAGSDKRIAFRVPCNPALDRVAAFEAPSLSERNRVLGVRFRGLAHGRPIAAMTMLDVRQPIVALCQLAHPRQYRRERRNLPGGRFRWCRVLRIPVNRARRFLVRVLHTIRYAIILARGAGHGLL
nr:DUF3991 domain-containing protein [uncultured Bilophila sp.]